MAKKIILTETFSSELKRCRAKLKITQKELSRRTGISLSNIKAWEQGKQMPNFDNWDILLNFFKATYTARELEKAYTREKGQ